jgi:DNA-binding Xre family transcriptional regulator
MPTNTRNTKHLGSTLDSLLKETGDFEAVYIATSKRLLVLKIQRALKRKRMSRTKFIVAMNIEETTMTRLLDPQQVGRVSLDTLLKASTTLGINLIDGSK